MEHYQETIPNLSNGTTFNDLKWPINPGFKVVSFLEVEYLKNGAS